jgi:uncharacterized protein
MANQLNFKTDISVSSQELYDWHMKPGSFDRIQPPWENARFVKRAPKIINDAEETLEVKIGPFVQKWQAAYYDVIPGKQFCDTQKSGPFKSWKHQHLCLTKNEKTSTLHDKIEYQLPLAPLSNWLAGSFTKKKMHRMFHYRHQVTQLDLERSQLFQGPSKCVLVTGGTGLVGSSLVPLLKNLGHKVFVLTRSPKDDSHIAWNPAKKTIEREKLTQFDTIIHLAGENVGGLWTKSYKEKMCSSRISSTQWFVDELLQHASNLKCFIAASGSNYYPTDTGEVYDESGSKGHGFLADLVSDWEAATQKIKTHNIRLVTLRISMVLSSRGGALQKMLLPAKLGINKSWGSGKHHFSWIAIDDLVDIIALAINSPDMNGIINVSSPNSISCRDFFTCLGKVFKMPQLIGVPAFILKAMPGGMGKEILLADNRLNPQVLSDLNYSYRYPGLESALRHQLGR